MVNRQEAMRHKTTEYEAELRTKTELVKTMAEADGRIKQERENHDLILEKVKLEAIEKRDTVLKAIGLDFAVFTGGDIAPLGCDAVTELHKLFDSEDQRNALNAFLFRTGTESNEFMMVYASNQPSQFDGAIMDRIGEMVEFGLPPAHERKKMIAMYIEKHLLNPPGRWATKVTTVDIGDEEIERVVEETEGFSGRAISKLTIAWQASAYGTDGAIPDQETSFFKTVEHHKKDMSQKDDWITTERANMLTTDR